MNDVHVESGRFCEKRALDRVACREVGYFRREARFVLRHDCISVYAFPPLGIRGSHAVMNRPSSRGRHVMWLGLHPAQKEAAQSTVEGSSDAA